MPELSMRPPTLAARADASLESPGIGLLVGALLVLVVVLAVFPVFHESLPPAPIFAPG